VGLINEIGIEKVGEHVLCLTDYLIDSLQQQGLEIVTPLNRQHRSSIVTFTVGDVDQNVALVDYLRQHKVLVSLRYTSGVGGVRVACHLFNNREDIGRLVEATGEFVRRHAKATA
jgi:selenocysteine lyase/cysteine desulfurase